MPLPAEESARPQTEDFDQVHVFGQADRPIFDSKILPILQRGTSMGLTAVGKLTRGRPPSYEPFVRLVGMRLFARRLYGALIDANGASYADVNETLGRIRSLKPQVWASEWRRTAERFDRLGRKAAAMGQAATARELLLRASNYYRFAEMTLLADTPDREELQRASVDAYVTAGPFMDPPLERICLPIDGHESPAYIRLPRGIDRPPIVLIIPGLGMVKEHGDFPDDVVLSRGMAAMTVDLPGQGESRQHFALNQANAITIAEAAIDYLMTRSDVDTDRLGVVGTSLGAAAAMLAAATDRRIKALVEIAGFYYPTAWWDRFPPGIKEFLRYVMGAADESELIEMVRPVNLQGHVKQIECPLLVVHGQQDPIVPFEESDLIYDEARSPKERFIFANGDHACVNVGEARPLIGDWLASKLKVSVKRL